jgi:hypothetical protein
MQLDPPTRPETTVFVAEMEDSREEEAPFELTNQVIVVRKINY